jgi:hypothetical protein
MSSNPSLRDLYNSPSSAWAFVPPPPPVHNASAPASSPAPAVPTMASYQWTTRPAHNSIFDLSPSLDLNEPASLNGPLLLRSLVASALLQYTSTALVMPLEVGKLLLQIQWIPKDAPALPSAHADEDEEEEEAVGGNLACVIFTIFKFSLSLVTLPTRTSPTLRTPLLRTSSTQRQSQLTIRVMSLGRLSWKMEHALNSSFQWAV